MFGVVYKYISEYTGEEIWEVHERCKLWFNPKITVDENNNFIVDGDTTADFTNINMVEYIEKIRRYYNYLRIPDPNEVPLEVYEKLIAEGRIKEVNY